MMKDIFVECIELPYGIIGAIKMVEARFTGQMLKKLYDCEKADVSEEDKWFCSYAIIPKHIADKIGWVEDGFEFYEGLPVHGKCTFAKRGDVPGSNFAESTDMVIGWDYGHYGDTLAEYNLEKVRSDLLSFGEYIRAMIEA